MSMKNSNDTIGNRTHDLLACSAMPQPTAPPRAPKYGIMEAKNGGQRGSMWFQEYTLCWEVCTTKTWEMPLIPAKSDACMSTSWSLGNVFRRLSHARVERGFLMR